MAYAALTTTLTAMKVWGKHSSADNDARLTELINEVDQAVAQWLDRPLLQTTRSERIGRIYEYQNTVFLKATPVVSINSVRIDTTRAFTGPAEATSSYEFDPDTGVLEFDHDLTPGFRIMEVQYLGGMAPDAATFIDTYPQIHHWVNAQVEYEWERRNNVGAQSVTQGGGASRTFIGQVQMLKGLLGALRPEKRERADL